MTRFLFALICWLLASTASAQWKKIAQFPQTPPTPQIVRSIYFQDSEGAPQNGFVALGNSVNGLDFSLWFTTDSGLSWTNATTAKNTGADTPTNFTFKDQLTGWLSVFWSGERLIKTTDGGITWSLDTVTGTESAVKYHKPSELLFVGHRIHDEFGTRQGDIVSGRPRSITSFSNDTDGIAGQYDQFFRGHSLTSDGGKTWTTSTSLGNVNFIEALPIKGTQTFFVASSNPNYGDFFRTDDAGKTWRKLSAIPYTPGDRDIYLQGDLNKLFALTYGGVWLSTDQGNSWRSICGPVLWYILATPIYVSGNRVYAADTSGGLWFLDASVLDPEPQFSSRILEFASPCEPVSNFIEITSQDPCGVTYAEIQEVVVSGSSDFSFVPKAFPDTISVRDTLEFLYTPSGTQYDTAIVQIRYTVGAEEKDTIITLYGSSSSRENITFNTSLTINNISATELTEYLITPSKTFIGKNLSEITSDVTFDADLLEPIDFSTDIQNAVITYTNTPLTNGVITYHLRITGTDMSLDPSKAIARIRLLTYITDTISIPIALSNIKLNGFDPDYERCTLTASSSDTTFTLALLCGDRMLTDFLRGRNAIAINSINPNPAQDELNINVRTSLNELATVRIIDMSGKSVRQMTEPVSPSFKVLKFNTTGIPSGTYILDIQTVSGKASQKFSIER